MYWSIIQFNIMINTPLQLFFFPVYIKKELLRLMDLTHRFLFNSQMMSVDVLYRNKPTKYFLDIITKRNGIMIPYIKDNNGDQASPINNKINGLFFNVSGRHNMRPSSPFGNFRFVTDVTRLLRYNSHLYFSDFYCTSNKGHYITLVVTTPGTIADILCERYLPRLNLYNNRYMQFNPYTHEVSVANARGLLTEILITDTVNINNGTFYEVRTVGCGHSTANGIPKKRNCSICNIYQP